MRITSLANPKIKTARRLRERRHREREGCFLIEGQREIALAQGAGIELETLFVCPELLRETTGVEQSGAIEVSANVFGKLAVRSGGMVAVAHIPRRTLADLPRPPEPVYLIADQVEKPGNLGAILRSADGAGIDGVVVCGGTDLWNPNVVRTSLGTLFTVPVAEATPEAAIHWLAELPIVVATPEAELLYTEAPLAGAIVVGSEDTGVGPTLRRAATRTVRVPMRGVADSLNVAMTATLLAYAACQDRRQGSAGSSR